MEIITTPNRDYLERIERTVCFDVVSGNAYATEQVRVDPGTYYLDQRNLKLDNIRETPFKKFTLRDGEWEGKLTYFKRRRGFDDISLTLSHVAALAYKDQLEKRWADIKNITTGELRYSYDGVPFKRRQWLDFCAENLGFFKYKENCFDPIDDGVDTEIFYPADIWLDENSQVVSFEVSSLRKVYRAEEDYSKIFFGK